jgi:hypothetical protein
MFDQRGQKVGHQVNVRTLPTLIESPVRTGRATVVLSLFLPDGAGSSHIPCQWVRITPYEIITEKGIVARHVGDMWRTDPSLTHPPVARDYESAMVDRLMPSADELDAALSVFEPQRYGPDAERP